MNPKITDNDKDTITVEHGGKVIRSYDYKNDDERRLRTVRAHEYVEGWCAGGSAKAQSIKSGIDTRFNDRLVEMKPEYDDSVTGFNEAWEVIRTMYAEAWVYS